MSKLFLLESTYFLKGSFRFFCEVVIYLFCLALILYLIKETRLLITIYKTTDHLLEIFLPHTSLYSPYNLNSNGDSVALPIDALTNKTPLPTEVILFLFQDYIINFSVSSTKVP